jgi:hypothetical protein
MARRPTPRPRDKAEEFINERESRRLERLDDGPSRAEMELGPLSAPSRSLRPQPRPKRFEAGGMVTGSRAQISGTKFSGTF